MAHPLVLQLRFARSEFMRALEGVSDDDARRRVLPMNCISWNVGHLAWQEQRYWLTRAQDRVLVPQLNELFAAPACTPTLDEARGYWRTVTEAADPWLDTLTTDDLDSQRTFGTMMLRMIYHYWYHTGENMAIRQQLGHAGLPDFVGNINDEAPYQRE
jgi:hypothetical protein